MKLDGNARTCLHSRLLLVRRAVNEGWTLAQAAEAAGVRCARSRSRCLATVRRARGRCSIRQKERRYKATEVSDASTRLGATVAPVKAARLFRKRLQPVSTGGSVLHAPSAVDERRGASVICRTRFAQVLETVNQLEALRVSTRDPLD
jgi:hypothetical protein